MVKLIHIPIAAQHLHNLAERRPRQKKKKKKEKEARASNLPAVIALLCGRRKIKKPQAVGAYKSLKSNKKTSKNTLKSS